MLNVKSEKGFYFTNPQDYLDGKVNDLNEMTYTAFGVRTHDDIYRDETCGWGIGIAHFLGKNGITMTKEKFAEIIEKELSEFDYPFYVQKLKPSLTWREKGCTFPIEDLALLEKLEEENSWRPQQWVRDTTKPLDASLSYPLKEKAPEPMMHVVVDEFREKAHPITDRKDLPEYLVVSVKVSSSRYNIGLSDAEREKIDDFCEKLKNLMTKTFGEKAETWQHSDSKSTSKKINGDVINSIKDINGKACKVGDAVYYAAHSGDMRLGKITKFTDISIFIDDVCWGKADNFNVLKA